ncbi:MAG: phosphodiesterase [Rhodospirillaceae bacterium]|jgi:3',5'-cyclic AMP phosphodiesterase CpdA|nr:phosphodiesterase [Rhodospirillaceae bacterium]MBT3491856.1 phosphodiesterase [Rhodospirillaceae bacterium]MBT3783088.1 phosphodiesterase [Rhodospirillaceae bacterium]MBT3978084.1 phosphodiesterase [Rhodospirillaceae bacterium]MBT4170591.1 phosphodiesterase [Rhodospirillaceae bacterium]
MFNFAQISDCHISEPHGMADRMYQTARHLRRAVAHLNGLAQPPDFVLCTGDLVDSGGSGEYAILADLLGQLAAPFYLLPGNHDDRDAMRLAFPEHGYLAGPEGFMQYTIEDWPLRLIALDTLVPGQSGGQLCEIRLKWLDEKLSEQPDRPTVLFMHHPPFRAGLVKMDKVGLEDRTGLADLVRRHGQVEAILAGHLHRFITRRFAGTVAMTAPGTAHQIALEPGPEERLSLTMEPPGCLLHLWLGGEDGLVSHVSYTGGCYPVHTVFADG